MFTSHSLIPVALLCYSVLASPLQRRESTGVISGSLLDSFNLYEQYAATAYCHANTHSPMSSKIACAKGNCQRVAQADTKSALEFHSKALTGATGYLAFDKTNQVVILSFRGSESVMNWVTDLTVVPVPVDLCNGCLAHGGIWTSWLAVRDEIKEAMIVTAGVHPGYKIVVTGHSLGAGLATFAATEFRNLGLTVDLVSLASPRVGNPALARYITNQSPMLGQNYRFTHLNDPVPNFPTEALGFQHPSPEYYIKSPNGAPVTNNDITVCAGLGNSNCNARWKTSDPNAHDWYFDKVSACYDGGIETGVLNLGINTGLNLV